MDQVSHAMVNFVKQWWVCGKWWPSASNSACLKEMLSLYKAGYIIMYFDLNEPMYSIAED